MTDTCNSLDERQGGYAKRKQSISKGYILHDSISVTFISKHNYRDGEQISGCQGLGVHLKEQQDGVLW